MLHTEAVEQGTLALLRRLQSLPEFNDYFLVGGTALALKFGHRISVDLDLFTHLSFKKENILDALEKEFGKEFEYSANPLQWGIFSFIQNIKVDIIKYEHPLVRETEQIQGIRMYSTADVAAMKINAILGRGAKKDFWDIFELLQHHTIEELIEFYYAKFSKQVLLISIPQSLTYFADAEESEDPVSLKGQSWEKVKHVIQQRVSEYLK